MRGQLNRLIWLHVYPFIAPLGCLWIKYLPVSKKVKQWYEYRRSQPDDETSFLIEKQSALFMCPSAGEYEAVKSIIKELKTLKPTLFIELSFFSPSGMAYLDALPDPHVDVISFWPIDTAKNVQAFFQTRSPQFICISTLSIWPCLMNHILETAIPYYFISEEILWSKRKRIRLWVFSHYLENASQIFETSTNLDTIQQLPQDNVTQIMDTRLANIHTNDNESNDIKSKLKKFKSQSELLVLGSTHRQDEDFIFQLVDSIISQNWKILVIPHEPSRADEIDKRLPKSVKWSESEHAGIEKIIVVDELGILKQSYSLSDLSYVGGAIGGQVHNLWEPILAGSPTVIGPSNNRIFHSKFLSQNVRIVNSPNDFMSVLEDANVKLKTRDLIRNELVLKSKDSILFIASKLSKHLT